jgi:hypothetical protein
MLFRLPFNRGALVFWYVLVRLFLLIQRRKTTLNLHHPVIEQLNKEAA